MGDFVISAKTLTSAMRRELSSENTCIKTKALKMKPLSSKSLWWQSSCAATVAVAATMGHFMSSRSAPANINTKHTVNWYTETPMMFRHICLLMRGAVRPNGLRFISSGDGGSVASASAPMESMIMLTQSRGTAASGSSLIPAMAAIRFKLTATTLTTSWNCKNFRID